MNSSVANRYRSDGMASTPPGRLLTMLYDRMLLDFDRAIDAIGRTSIEEAHNALIHAQEIVFELHMALDLEAWPDGGALADLYVYLTEQLSAANAKKSVALIENCRSVVEPLAESWHEAYRQTTSGLAGPSTAASTALSAGISA